MESNLQSAAGSVNLVGFRDLASWNFSRFPAVLEMHGREKRFVQAVGHLGELGSGSMLSLAMLEWIAEHNPAGARSALVHGASVIHRLGEPLLPGAPGWAGRRLIDAAEDEFLRVEGIHRRNATMDMRDGPFCLVAAAVLTNALQEHLPLLRGLAPLIREHNDDNYASLDALGLLAFITGDESLRQAFDYRVERYLKAKFLLSFFRGTMIQIQALLARDQVALDAATEQTAIEFLRRGKDKKTLGQRQGLGMYSQVEFDLRGTTVGKLARMTGMRFEHDSRAIPLGVIRMFE